MRCVLQQMRPLREVREIVSSQEALKEALAGMRDRFSLVGRGVCAGYAKSFVVQDHNKVQRRRKSRKKARTQPTNTRDETKTNATRKQRTKSGADQNRMGDEELGQSL